MHRANIRTQHMSGTHRMLNKGRPLLFIKVRLELGCRLLTADLTEVHVLWLINWLHSRSLFQVSPEQHRKEGLGPQRSEF